MRVSLFGGGTDYPEYFHDNPGAVIGFAIDKYIYISAIKLHALVDYRYRIAYSKVEIVDDVNAIEHPVVRGVLQETAWSHPMDYTVQQDLPAASGLGSSSAFTAGFVNLVLAHKGIRPSKLDLARYAVHIERNVLGEHVGIQDQLHASFGGFRRYDFQGQRIAVHSLGIDEKKAQLFTDWLVLVHTGRKRRATQIIEEQIKRTVSHQVDRQLAQLFDIVNQAQEIIASTPGDTLAAALAPLLADSWKIKRGLSTRVSDDRIDELYDLCISHGALSGKLCGAGGGGFLLMIVPPDRRKNFVAAIGERRCVPIAVDFSGSTVTELPNRSGSSGWQEQETSHAAFTISGDGLSDRAL